MSQGKGPKPILQDIKGKPYETVKSRTARFRHDHPDGCIKTTITHISETRVCCSCTVLSGDGRELGTDVAEEIFGSTYINETSAVENCSTSARGRALDAAGYNASNEVASFEEVAQAISRQSSPKARKPAPEASESWGGSDTPKASESSTEDSTASGGEVSIVGAFLDESTKKDGSPFWTLKDKAGKRYRIWDMARPLLLIW